MSLEERIKKRLKKEAFGIFVVELKTNYRFELGYDRKAEEKCIRVKSNPYLVARDEELIISGHHRDEDNLQPRHFELLVLREVWAHIPYSAIHSYRRIGDLFINDD